MTTPAGIITRECVTRKQHGGRAATRSRPKPVRRAEPEPTGHNRSTDIWTRRGGMLGGRLILLGSILPLLKHSITEGGSVWVWPWTLLVPGKSMAVAAATATYSTGQNYGPFVFIPAIAGLLAMFLANTRPLMVRTTSSFVLGSVFLLVMLAGMTAEGEIYGLSFIPPTATGGVLMTVGVLAVAVVASCNRLRKMNPGAKPLRIASGVAGGLLGLMFTITLLAGANAWTGWTVRLLSIGFIAYGFLAVRMSVVKAPQESLFRLSSLAIRGLAICAPIACLVAQLTTTDPFTNFVVGGGGGFANVFFSIVKSTAVYMGAALLVAFGLSGTLTQLLESGTGRGRGKDDRK